MTMDGTPDVEWLTIEEAAAWIGGGLNKKTLYEAIRRNEIPHLSLGDRKFIGKTSLRDFPLDKWLVEHAAPQTGSGSDLGQAPTIQR
jgi:excisionase family DNA binding protein